MRYVRMSLGMKAFIFILLLTLLAACAKKFTIALPEYSEKALPCITNNDRDTSGKCMGLHAQAEKIDWSQISAVATKILKADLSKNEKHKLVVNILTDDIHRVLMEQILNQLSANSNSSIDLSIDTFKIFFANIWTAIQVNAWKNYYEIYSDIPKRVPNLTESEKKAIEVLKDIGKFQYEYTQAYFRTGKFTQVEFNPKEAQQRVKEQLAEAIPTIQDSDIQNIFANLEKLIEKKDNGNYILYSRVSGEVFRSRGGADYGFPIVTASFEPYAKKPVNLTKIDFLGIGTDLLRLFIEANADAFLKLPADQTSTACKAKLLKPFLPNETPDPEESSKSITSTQFAQVNAIANNVDALVGVGTSVIIRGMNMSALNNEALAKMIETSMAATFRKVYEKIAWCAFSCYNLEDKGATIGKREQDIFDSIRQIMVTIK
jgi:hypothetical protein